MRYWTFRTLYNHNKNLLMSLDINIFITKNKIYKIFEPFKAGLATFGICAKPEYSINTYVYSMNIVLDTSSCILEWYAI